MGYMMNTYWDTSKYTFALVKCEITISPTMMEKIQSEWNLKKECPVPLIGKFNIKNEWQRPGEVLPQSGGAKNPHLHQVPPE